MERTKNRREHYNLYYIFLDDKKAHLLSVDKKIKYGKI